MTQAELIRRLESKGLLEDFPALGHFNFVSDIITGRHVLSHEVARRIEIALDLQPYSIVKICSDEPDRVVKKRLAELDKKYKNTGG